MGKGWIPRISLNGLQQSIRTLRAVEKFHSARLIQSAATMTATIFIRSQFYCPVETGQLKLSGDWGLDRGGFLAIRGGFELFSLLAGTISKEVGAQVTFTIVYNAPYAIFVHENLGNTHAAPTRAKFLEYAANEIVAEENNHVPWSETGAFTTYPVKEPEAF